MTAGTRQPPLYRRAARWARRRIVPRGVILMYHRIADEKRDPWRLCVSPKNFAEQLEFMRAERINILSATAFAQSIAAGTVPRRSVVITFDDGYRDNLDQARPVLERYNAPAMLFAASDYIGSGREFWWDALERIFLEPGEIPVSLDLAIDGTHLHWDFTGEERWSDDDASRHSDWRPSGDAICQRHRAYRDIRLQLMSMNSNGRRAYVDNLLEWAGLPQTARASREILDDAGLQAIAKDDLVEIGGHSVSHPDLRNLSPEEQEVELRGGKAALESKLGGKAIVGLAYPHGGCTEITRQIARNSGYGFACGTQHRAVEKGADLFELPRIGVRNENGAAFRAGLAGFLPV